MNKKQIIGAVVAAVLFIAIGVSSVLTSAMSRSITSGRAIEEMAHLLSGGYEITLPKEDYIGIVEVVGTIMEQTTTNALSAPAGYQHQTTLDYIDSLMADEFNKGILLYVDSPGGAVYESEELYQKLLEYKESTGRPIWNYMAHYAASGGYYVAMPSDHIVANPNTTTGSIGVIMSAYDLTGLYEKLGIEEIVIASGDNKAQVFNEEQTAIYQSIVDETYARFVEIVAKGRDMSEEQVKPLADGRIFSALQAKEAGLIDDIALYPAMQSDMSEALGVYEFYSLPVTTGIWRDLFGVASSMIPKSEAQILERLKEETKSGIPMYYAQGLE